MFSTKQVLLYTLYKKSVDKKKNYGTMLLCNEKCGSFMVCGEVTALAKPTDKFPSSPKGLVLSAQQGDQAAFSRLAAEYMPFVRRSAARYSTPLLDRDDLVQEGMLGLLSAVRTYKPERGISFEAYAGICVNNKMLSALRKASGGKSVRAGDVVLLDECAVWDAALPLEEQQDLRDACERLMHFAQNELSQSEQTVLNLFLGGLSYREIAEKIGATPKSVDNALQRVRRKLKNSKVLYSQ